MWLMLNDSFLSIVKKDCGRDELLVRARRPGDIERVFGRRVKVTRATDADYLYRAVLPRDEVEAAMVREVGRIDYDNFKSSVKDDELHDAYLRVWTAMAATQHPRPYSEPYTTYGTASWTDESAFAQPGLPVVDAGIKWKPNVPKVGKKGKKK